MLIEWSFDAMDNEEQLPRATSTLTVPRVTIDKCNNRYAVRHVSLGVRGRETR